MGNIPYDATEEKLKDIFSEVGPVISFKLVYDRESGKPKGYGFCEYKDIETAQSAMRNLSNYELNGRNLRVDAATNERIKEEMRNLQLSGSGSAYETPLGQEIDPKEAPEAISKAVASLPPEQMFELAKQMKQCIQTNPSEAKNMLIQNPQLAYALLQALVVMRVVDPSVAMSILHRPNPNQPQPLMPHSNAGPLIPPPQPPIFEPYGPGNTSMPSNRSGPPPQGMPPQQQPFENRIHDPRHDPRLRDGPPFDRFNQQSGPMPGPMTGPIPPQNLDPRTRPIDPRAQRGGGGAGNMGGPQLGMNRGGGAPFNSGPAGIQLPANFQTMNTPGANLTANQEQEKAQLIMQVLALSDQQIALLPAEQRQSIMLLKEQIQRGST